jgi:hypothetical protein
MSLYALILPYDYNRLFNAIVDSIKMSANSEWHDGTRPAEYIE